MNFETLFEKISPGLKRTAGRYNNRSSSVDADDLYQEMSVHLWNSFKDGLPSGLNEAYIVKGCEFHILNYLRKKREKVRILSLDEAVNASGETRRDILPSQTEPLDRWMDRKTVCEDIKNNGFTKREKGVFSLLLEGYTIRETGAKLGISHPMVVKYKQRIIAKWQKKVTKSSK